jgi:Na+-transporting NADH:ubiquinone oxidoreductase subunit NqrC
MSASRRTRNSSLFRHRYTFLGLLLLLFCSTIIADTEVTWTPNEDREAPLPLSTNQMQQLAQLEDVILKSPDPEATLNQAAQANNMDPMDLLDLLERNHRSMEEAGVLPAAGGAPSRQRNVWKIFTSLGVVIAQSASKNPKAFSLIATSLLLITYAAISAPRNGLVLSSSRGLISKGPTTMWSPPVRYVDQLLESPRFLNRRVSFSSKQAWQALNPLLDDEDGAVWHKLPKKTKAKADLQQAASSQVTIHLSDFDFQEVSDKDDENEEAEQQLLDLCFEHASNVLSDRQLTEWARPPNSLRLIPQKDSQKQHAVLIVRKMGDWGRYGLLPLQVVDQQEGDDDVVSLTFSTLKGSHWDGQIHVEITKTAKDLVVQVHLLVPRKGQKVPRKTAMSIVEGISQSVALSAKTRTKQSLARRSQSSRFQGKAHSRAAERRKTRFNKEKELEEMSEDRRRRWQRQNPDAGRYRPSGDRMRSPNNC